MYSSSEKVNYYGNDYWQLNGNIYKIMGNYWCQIILWNPCHTESSTEQISDSCDVHVCCETKLLHINKECHETKCLCSKKSTLEIRTDNCN